MTGELEPGLVVDGRYQLLFRLGKGGMGEVWAAAHSQSALGFSKTVALKVLRTEEMTSNSAKMFFDEANAASALQHAAIVSTTDLGRDGDILFIAMELVRGPSLTAVLQRLVINKRGMSAALVGHLGVQIASALDFAQVRASHQGQLLKLVHRDISPHNVLVDLNGSVKLTDFGVARTTIQSHESHVGTVRGKPSYMAPEQVVGGDIDARTDLFALGIVLYESACLKRLFGRSNPVKSMDAVLKHDPKPLLELMPEFPPKLWSVIEKALKKDPNERFQSAAEMLDALNEACRGLEGYSSAPRDFVALIDKNFEAGAFDIDGRVQLALSEVAAAQPAPVVGLPRPSIASPMVSPVISTFAPELGGTKAAWPSAYAADPLAPEAIEEARTQFRAVTPSQTAAMPTSHSQEAMRALTQSSSSSGSHASLTGLSMAAQPRRKALGPALMLGAAAVVLLGAAALVVAKSNKNEPTALRAERTLEAEPPTAIDVTPRTAPSVTVLPGKAPEKKPEPTPQELAATQQTKSTPRTPSRPNNPQPPPPKGEPEEAQPALTWKHVFNVVKQAQSKDPNRGGKLMATMSEIGATSEDTPERTKTLQSVMREAKEIIGSDLK